eukprot:6065585-Prymnesium_polylepis.1
MARATSMRGEKESSLISPGRARTASTMNSAAEMLVAGIASHNARSASSGAAPKPVSPWKREPSTSSGSDVPSGNRAPVYTGTSERLAAASRRRAFFVVSRGSAWQPKELATPRTSSSGAPSAQSSAAASSTPTSATMMTGVAAADAYCKEASRRTVIVPRDRG